MKGYWKEMSGFLKNRLFMVCLALLMVIAFGYAAMNTAISIDDTEMDRYVGSGMEMIRAGRFGMWFWHVIQGGYNTGVSMDILAVLLMIAGACSCCVLFKRASQDRISKPAFAVFILMAVTYPLVQEIWEFTGANVVVYGSILCATWAIALMYGQIQEESWRKPWRAVLAALLMMLVCASYESVVPVYIFLVCAVLALQAVYGSQKQKKLLEILRQGLLYAGVLAIGLALRLIVHRVMLAVCGLEMGANGHTAILWGTAPVTTVVKQLLLEWLRYYGLNGIIYYPIGLMQVSVIVLIIVGLVACKKHGAALLLPGAGMLLSLIALSLLQGTFSYYRSCQVFGILCAFVAMLLADRLTGKKKWIRVTAALLCGWLILFQATYINYFLELDVRRSQQEAETVRQIGTQLEREYDLSKPVIFVGKYSLIEGIEEAGSLPEDSVRWRVYKAIGDFGYRLSGNDPSTLKYRRLLPTTNIKSVIHWSIEAFYQESMEKLFAYYGYEIEIADYAQVYDEALAYAEETDMPAYPRNGYIKDVGEYIIVYLQ